MHNSRRACVKQDHQTFRNGHWVKLHGLLEISSLQRRGVPLTPQQRFTKQSNSSLSAQMFLRFPGCLRANLLVVVLQPLQEFHNHVWELCGQVVVFTWIICDVVQARCLQIGSIHLGQKCVTAKSFQLDLGKVCPLLGGFYWPVWADNWLRHWLAC